MLACVLTRACWGTEAPQVFVEVSCGSGLPTCLIVGRADGALRESRDRVRAALTHAGFKFPAGRVLISLGPAELPKSGSHYDLAIALGILAASRQIPADELASCEYLGELGLDGALKPVRGVLPAVCEAAKARHRVIVPYGNLGEADLIAGAQVAGADHLLEVCAHLKRTRALQFSRCSGGGDFAPAVRYPDLSDVRGQLAARRALEIAAAGSHHLALMGSIGTGKSLLAQRLPGILPPLTEDEAREVAAIESVSSGGFEPASWKVRRLRSPHHTTPPLAMSGGGTYPRPGEVSLAHHGVLFLDEALLFIAGSLEALREPLETRTICVSRVGRQVVFPARFQLILAFNHCVCGLAGDGTNRCRCSEGELRRYRGRLSAALLDRLDLHVRMQKVDLDSLDGEQDCGESSAVVAARVLRARERQAARQGVLNADLSVAAVAEHCQTDAEGLRLLNRFAKSVHLSARAHGKILLVARTLADLDGESSIAAVHVAEALMFRQLDRPMPFEGLGRDRSYGNDAPDALSRN